MATPDQNAAEKIGRAIDGQIFRLQEERLSLQTAAARIIDIDAEVAALQLEKVRIDPRRPPRPPQSEPPGRTTPSPGPTVDLPGRDR
jgi:hypothetical protein